MDYTDCVQDLLDRLLAAGFEIDWVDDGSDFGEGFTKAPTTEQALECILSIDESLMQVSLDDIPFALYITLGNGKGEIVSDYATIRKADVSAIENLIKEFYEKWEDA